MEQINTQEEYNLALAESETYLAKGFDNLTPEEDDQLSHLSEKVRMYESIHFPMPLNIATNNL